jgi:hypothetical protein
MKVVNFNSGIKKSLTYVITQHVMKNVLYVSGFIQRIYTLIVCFTVYLFW